MAEENANQGGEQAGGEQQAQGGQQAPGGEQAKGSWTDQLPEDIRGAPSLKTVKSIEDMAKQFIDAQSALGRALRIPSEHASPEERAAFRKRVAEHVPGLVELNTDDPDAVRLTLRQLGAPEEVAGYKLPEALQAAAGPDMAPVAEFAEWAHEAALTQRQFEAVAQKFTERQQQAAAQAATAHETGMRELRAEWGMAYAERVTGAAQMLRAYGAPDEVVRAVEAGKVRPELLRLFGSIADAMGKTGGGRPPGARDLERGQLTPSEAQAQLDEIHANQEHAYWKAPQGSPEQARAIEQYQKLLIQADPSLRQPHTIAQGPDED